MSLFCDSVDDRPDPTTKYPQHSLPTTARFIILQRGPFTILSSHFHLPFPPHQSTLLEHPPPSKLELTNTTNTAAYLRHHQHIHLNPSIFRKWKKAGITYAAVAAKTSARRAVVSNPTLAAKSMVNMPISAILHFGMVTL